MVATRASACKVSAKMGSTKAKLRLGWLVDAEGSTASLDLP
jgi:hypothetical protein